MVSDDHSDSEESWEDDLDIHAVINFSERPRLIQTDAGTLMLTDQDIDTYCVVQRAIFEAKVHMMFVNRYLELTKKSLFTQDALLTAACTCSILPIQHHLKTDDLYITALATLICLRVVLSPILLVG
jgi:hypothetical protein